MVAIYHLHVKNISRGDGRSIVAAAAYRAGETLVNEIEEGLSEFGGRRDVVATEIRLPTGAPRWMSDRTQLWNAVEVAEKRKDARLAKELEFALPRELPREVWLDVARAMADHYTARGFVVDLAIHEDGSGNNPHVHLLLATRSVTPTGFGLKIRSADGVQFVKDARARWAIIANQALGKAGSSATIDSRSFARRGIERRPGQHRGPDPAERRTKRALLHQQRSVIMPDIRDEDLPVPDPDGNPIHPRELEAAEQRMMDDMRREGSAPVFEQQGDLASAVASIDAQNRQEVSDDDAAAYRLAPDDRLAWLREPNAQTASKDEHVLERWENRLSWLELDTRTEDKLVRSDRAHEQERER